MTVGRRGIVSVVVVTLVAILLSAVTVAIRLMLPSTGTVVAGSGSGFAPDGIPITVLPGATTPLRDGDVVTGIAGRSMTSWAEDWLALGGPSGTASTVAMDVRRDGGIRSLEVPLGAYPLDVLGVSAGTLGFVLVMLGIGVFVFTLRPGVPAAGALLLAGAGAAGSTLPFLLGQDPLDLTRGVFAFGLLTTGFVYLLLWAGLIDFVLVFPRPIGAVARRPVRRVIPYAAMFAGYLAAIVVTGVTSPTVLAWIGTWGPLSLVPSIVTFLVTPAVLVIRWRTGPREDRALMRGFALVMGFIILADAVIWMIPEALGGRPLIPWSVAGVLGLPFPILVASAIVRHRAFDIDVVVRRSLVYGGLTVAIVGTYAAAAAVLGAALGSSSAFATSLLATGVAALVALPVRDALQRAVTRLLYGDRAEPVRAIRRLGERLALSADAATMARIVVDTVADALRLPYVGLELGVEGAARLVAERGTAPADVTARELTAEGRRVGRLLVAPRSTAEPLVASDVALLDDLSRQIGAAAHAALLTEDLRASRERIITAREEERRRLRRDLHDGLGPSLAGIGMRAGAAEELIRQDPAAATRLLAELQAEASAAVGEVRRLVDGLRPPAIDEVGLLGALRLAADRLEAPGAPDVSVEAEGELPALPAAVEVAAYRIGTEALTNAVRHAAAARCSVRLRSGDALTLVVEDDGRGLPADPRPGVGLASMHERAAEVGGECRIEPRPGGGTRVIARLPLSLAPAPGVP
jgi:signal transduction histidine kinase